jgi:hypothetical protein
METNTGLEFHHADYTEQRIPQYRGNPLIEALRPAADDETLIGELFDMPKFSTEQRNWTTAERMQMVAQLASFMLPLPRHLNLAHGLDALMRQGYVGRIPRSAASHCIFGKLHEQLQKKTTFSTCGNITAQLTSTLIGLSGMGKTTTVKRLLAREHEVIYHPEYGVYQIPYLHIETPYDGASVKGLAHSIFRKVDKLLPEAGYGEQYARNASTGAETLMNHAARILHMHCVGLLVIDEIQNLENSPKNRQSLMSLLVSASNELGVPILFIGTNKARRILSLDFRQARRSIGQGLTYWDGLKKGAPGNPNEWEDFVSILWRFQWVRNPAAESPFLSDLLYDHSQGIVDIAIKLFAACQIRAMLDGSETITGQLIADVAKRELAMVEPMIDALRRDDIHALQACDDIAPLNLEYLLKNIQQSYAGRKVRGATIGTNNELFVPTVAAALEAVGFAPEAANDMAENVASTGTGNAVDGVKKALTTSTAGPKAKSVKNKDGKKQKVEYLPGDFRNALLTVGDETVFQRLETNGMLPDLEKVLSI